MAVIIPSRPFSISEDISVGPSYHINSTTLLMTSSIGAFPNFLAVEEIKKRKNMY